MGRSVILGLGAFQVTRSIFLGGRLVVILDFRSFFYMCKCQQNVCLCLFDAEGRTEFQHWYSTVNSARAVKSKLSYRFKPGFTWVLWTFDTAGNKLLLSSSRPLKFEWVKQADLI